MSWFPLIYAHRLANCYENKSHTSILYALLRGFMISGMDNIELTLETLKIYNEKADFNNYCESVNNMPFYFFLGTDEEVIRLKIINKYKINEDRESVSFSFNPKFTQYLRWVFKNPPE